MDPDRITHRSVRLRDSQWEWVGQEAAKEQLTKSAYLARLIAREQDRVARAARRMAS